MYRRLAEEVELAGNVAQTVVFLCKSFGELYTHHVRPLRQREARRRARQAPEGGEEAEEEGEEREVDEALVRTLEELCDDAVVVLVQRVGRQVDAAEKEKQARIAEHVRLYPLSTAERVASSPPPSPRVRAVATRVKARGAGSRLASREWERQQAV